MPEASEQPAKPADGSRRVYILWTVGLGLLLLLALACWLVVGPALQARREIRISIAEDRLQVDFLIPHPDIRSRRLQTVARLGGDREAALKLRVFLLMPDWFTEGLGQPDDLGGKEWATLLLGHCGEPGARQLIARLGHKIPYCRYVAIVALVEGGPQARLALPALERRLTDENSEVRSAAAEALKKIRGEAPPK